MEAWVSYVYGHASLVRRLNAELMEEHIQLKKGLGGP